MRAIELPLQNSELLAKSSSFQSQQPPREDRVPLPALRERWLAFLSNHREVIAAFDFFTVPTITFRVLSP